MYLVELHDILVVDSLKDIDFISNGSPASSLGVKIFFFESLDCEEIVVFGISGEIDFSETAFSQDSFYLISFVKISSDHDATEMFDPFSAVCL